ncbi:hypothetical protein NDU88_004048, partial [Pleurodeles waltl]
MWKPHTVSKTQGSEVSCAQFSAKRAILPPSSRGEKRGVLTYASSLRVGTSSVETGGTSSTRASVGKE